MNNLPAWTPEEIGKLTPLQLMVMVSKEPPKPGMHADESVDYAEVIRKEEEDWRA